VNEQPHIHYVHNSEIGTYRTCTKKHDYRYRQHLIPKREDRPITFGLWWHRMQETYYAEGDWKIGWSEYKKLYDKLFDEERESLDKGKEPLPLQLSRLMQSYLDNYGIEDERWTVIAVEWEWKIDYVHPTLGLVHLGGRIDLIMRDENGLIWVWDHKSTTSIPDRGAFHAMDPQLTLYPWAYEQITGESVAGVLYNYAVSKPPTIPTMTQKGEVSKVAITTDWRTARDFLIANGKDPDNYSGWLNELRAKNELFERMTLPRSSRVTKQILDEAVQVAIAIESGLPPTRNIGRMTCDGCRYQKLCRAELFGLDTSRMRRQEYTVDLDVTPGNEGER
jgi:hypothetical protein